MRRFFVALICAAMLAMPSVLSAHAKLVSSNPAAGATLDAAPSAIVLTFNDELSTEGPVLTVTGPDGARADAGDAAVDLGDLERKTLRASLKPNLAPGAYTVSWTIVGSDGHEISDTFTFTLAGSGAAPTRPAPAPAPAPQATLPATGAFGGVSLALVAVALGCVVAGMALRRVRAA